MHSAQLADMLTSLLWCMAMLHIYMTYTVVGQPEPTRPTSRAAYQVHAAVSFTALYSSIWHPRVSQVFEAQQRPKSKPLSAEQLLTWSSHSIQHTEANL